jgi:acyl carrier protein
MSAMSPEEVLAKVFGAPAAEMRDSTSNRTLPAWDSLGHMTLILELEATYGVSFSADEALAMNDLGAIKTLLRARGVTW